MRKLNPVRDRTKSETRSTNFCNFLNCWGTFIFLTVISGGLVNLSTAVAEDAFGTSLSGRVLTESGDPIENARVDIATAAPRTGPAIFCPSCYLDCQKWTKTSRTGSFEIHKLDPNLRFRLVVSSPGFRTFQTHLVTPEDGKIDLRLQTLPESISPDRIVSGIITTEQGIAIEGAFVSAYDFRKEDGLRIGHLDGVLPSVTDAKGKFEVYVPEPVKSMLVEISAQGTCGKVVYDLVQGAQPQTVEIPTGTSVIGQLTRNGHPVAGMSIAVAQTDRCDSEECGIFVKAIHAITDAEGRFQFKYLPPSQQYCIYSVVGEAKRSESPYVLAVRVFDAPESEKTIDLGSLEVTDPISIRGRITPTDGEALPENLTLMLGRNPPWDLVKLPVEPDGSFSISGIPPEQYEVTLFSPHLRLDPDRIDSLLWYEYSFQLNVTQSIENLIVPVIRKLEIEPRELPWTQTLSGIVVGTDGKPLSGIYFSASDSVDEVAKGDGDGENPPRGTTDNDGKFSITKLPEARLWLKIYRPLPDGRTFRFLGMIQPRQGADDLRITIPPDWTSQIEQIRGEVK